MNRLCKQHGEGTGMCKKHGGGKLCYYIVVTEGKAVAAPNKLSNDTSDSLPFLSIVVGFAPLLARVAVQVAAPSAMCDSSQGVPVGKRKEDRMASEENKPEKNDTE